MMKLCFFLLLMLAGAASEGVEKRIVGSQSCGKERQYHVQVEPYQGGTFCGGSLLNTRWVLTASHCGQRRLKVKFGLNYDVKWWKTIKNAFKGKKVKTEQDIQTAQQFTYKGEDEKPHDIMLIKLNEDVSPKLAMIKLPPAASCARPETGQEVRIGGWGAKKADVTITKNPKSLKCASTDITACGEDEKPDETYHSDETNTMCGWRPGVEACYGDAGTAVEFNGLLHGVIVSNPVDECANPIKMLDICHYRQWIDETMQKNK